MERPCCDDTNYRISISGSSSLPNNRNTSTPIGSIVLLEGSRRRPVGRTTRAARDKQIQESSYSSLKYHHRRRGSSFLPTFKVRVSTFLLLLQSLTIWLFVLAFSSGGDYFTVVEAKITLPLSNLFSRAEDVDHPTGSTATSGMASPSSSPPPTVVCSPTSTSSDLSAADDAFLQEQQRLFKEAIQRLWTQYVEDTAKIRSTVMTYSKTALSFVWYNIVLYKPPVGIVTAWTLIDLITSGRILRGIQNIINDATSIAAGDGTAAAVKNVGLGHGATGGVSELALQQRRRSKLDRHSGRALDLDNDDLTYQKYGGIERVRRQLAWEALGTFTESETETTPTSNDEGGNEIDSPAVDDNVKSLADSLVVVLKTGFSPGGSHTEHVQALIEPVARMEQNSIVLELFPPNASGKMTTKVSAGLQRSLSGDETNLLRVAIQSAEIHILDSMLRLIRDRLLRTSFRLSRSVKYWRNRVQSTTTLFPTNILNAFNPIIRDFFLGGVEGDRTRLALAEAAYNSEVERLGKIMTLLADRPVDMPDPKLTLALQKSIVESEARDKDRQASVAHQTPTSILQKLQFSIPNWSRRSLTSNFALRYNADGRGRFSFHVYSGSVGITSASALQVLLEDWDSLQQPWLREAQSWSLHARSLIFDTIQQALETSAQSTVALEEELAKCQSTWKLQRYDSMKGDDSSTYAILLDQWSFIYSMSRDIGRFRRVGEGKSLKLKEVNVIQWMRQWDLLGLPSAALKIYAASLVHRRLAPHWPMMEKIIKETLDTSLEIFKSRFWIPVKDLVDELMNRQSNPLLTGVSLQDEETSLDYMLRDLGFGDGTPATRHNAMVKASRQYEADMNDGLIRHAVGGRLVRLILIQVQQLKVGMLDAAKTIDVLFQANRFNIQLLAIIPATVIVWFGSNIIRRFLFTMRVKEIRPMKSVHSEMTEYLDAMESIVLLSNENETDEGLVHHQPQRRPVSSLMSEKQLGEFALAVYDYLLLLDYSSPQPFPKFQCDVIHETMTNFLGKGGSLGSLSPDSQLKFIKLVKGKHEELSKHL